MKTIPKFDGKRSFELLERQTSLGPRPPGTESHRRTIELIAAELARWCPEVERQPFTLEHLLARPVACCNITARFRGKTDGRGALLVGTHFDTRWVADRELTYERQYAPIPGANDGGSGTAIMLELARVIAQSPPPRDVVLAFFDGEDVGDLCGYPFYVGSSWYAAHAEELPGEVLILDMVGGERFNPDFDLNSLYFHSGRSDGQTPLEKCLKVAGKLGYRGFFDDKPLKYKCIGCDHVPFLERGIPSGVLIDIDYPQWHTQDDTLEHCSAETLTMVGRVAAGLIWGAV